MIEENNGAFEGRSMRRLDRVVYCMCAALGQEGRRKKDEAC